MGRKVPVRYINSFFSNGTFSVPYQRYDFNTYLRAKASESIETISDC